MLSAVAGAIRLDWLGELVLRLVSVEIRDIWGVLQGRPASSSGALGFSVFRELFLLFLSRDFGKLTELLCVVRDSNPRPGD
jgi:hypothetical protein